MSLRTRLALAVALITLVVVGGISAVTYGVVSQSMRREVDTFLDTRITVLSDQVREARTLIPFGRRFRNPLGEALLQARFDVSSQVIDPAGNVVFAIGDVACQPMLAHKATYEGELVAEIIAGHHRVYDAKTVPAVVFTDPEIAIAGLDEAAARARGEVKVGKVPFAAIGRALTTGETEGFYKVVIDAQSHLVLGVTICGAHASDLISEAALAVEMAAEALDIGLTIHPHPTFGEGVMEAAKAALGEAIHIINR